MNAKKIISTIVIIASLCLGIVATAETVEPKKINIGYYNVESGKMEVGTASLKKHIPVGYKDISYDVINENTYQRTSSEVSDKIKAELKAVAECTQAVFDGGVNYSGTPIVYGNFGRVDSAAWKYSLTIAPLAVPMLEEKYGMKADERIWFCLGDKKGKVIRVYMETMSEPVEEVELQQGSAYIFGRDDKHMAPEDSTQRQEACAMLYRLLKQNNSIKDFKPSKTTAENWSKNAIDYMIYIGMYDYEPGREAEISRGEAFKMFSLSLGYTNSNRENDEFYADILKQKGYVVGDENGDLKLNDKIKRAEFCKIYNMITGRDKMTLLDTEGKEITPKHYGIVDLNKGDWYYDVMLKATSAYSGKKIDVDMRSSRSEVDNY